MIRGNPLRRVNSGSPTKAHQKGVVRLCEPLFRRQSSSTEEKEGTTPTNVDAISRTCQHGTVEDSILSPLQLQPDQNSFFEKDYAILASKIQILAEKHNSLISESESYQEGEVAVEYRSKRPPKVDTMGEVRSNMIARIETDLQNHRQTLNAMVDIHTTSQSKVDIEKLSHVFPAILKDFDPERVIQEFHAKVELANKRKSHKKIVGLSPAWNAHLVSVAQLNTLLGIIEELMDSVQSQVHKYVAHQFALLYKSLAPFPTGKPFLKEIEPLFEEVQVATDCSTCVVLEPELVERILQLLHRVNAALNSTPNELLAKLEPFPIQIKDNSADVHS